MALNEFKSFIFVHEVTKTNLGFLVAKNDSSLAVTYQSNRSSSSCK